MEQNQLKSKMSWSDFKLNSDGMVPVIVQDYKTDEVLMLAYMNEKAYLTTLKLGKMTYWSRSRNELWTKGLTSGHVQYVKSLTIDCDNDTILAKVEQVGAACHIRKNARPGGDMYTGEISCKDEDGLRQFVDDHEGFIFAEEDSPEMVMLCFRHSDMRISPEEWEKMDCPVSVREIYGQMQEVKIVKDHKTHLTTFYY